MVLSLLNQRNPYWGLCAGAENPEGNVRKELVACPKGPWDHRSRARIHWLGWV